MIARHPPPRPVEPPGQAVRIPDFFVLGAPKAGTTSLYSYLAAHRRIFMPRIKEPFYFCADIPGYREKVSLITDMAKYLKLFEEASERYLACGEASPLYLCSQVAVPAILDFNPQARFIVMLRNPVDLVYSLHGQVVRNSVESVHDFEQAWRLQQERAHGRHLPPGCYDPAILQYRRVASLGEQMKRLLAHVPRERVQIVLFEELASAARSVYEAVLEFLGVPYDHRDAFPTANAHHGVRSRWVARMIKSPPFPLSVLRQQYRRRVGVGTWPARALSRLNQQSASRAPLHPELRRELEAEFHDDVCLLARLIGRDLSHWFPLRQAAPQGRLSNAWK